MINDRIQQPEFVRSFWKDSLIPYLFLPFGWGPKWPEIEVLKLRWSQDAEHRGRPMSHPPLPSYSRWLTQPLTVLLTSWRSSEPQGRELGKNMEKQQIYTVQYIYSIDIWNKFPRDKGLPLVSNHHLVITSQKFHQLVMNRRIDELSGESWCWIQRFLSVTARYWIHRFFWIQNEEMSTCSSSAKRFFRKNLRNTQYRRHPFKSSGSYLMCSFVGDYTS